MHADCLDKLLNAYIVNNLIWKTARENSEVFDNNFCSPKTENAGAETKKQSII